MVLSERRFRFVVVLGLLLVTAQAAVVGATAGTVDRVAAQTTPTPAAGGTEAGSADNGTPGVTVDLEGGAVVERANGTVYLRPREPFQLVLTRIDGSPDTFERTCVTVGENTSVGWMRCTDLAGGGRSSAGSTERLPFDWWPTERSGTHPVTVSVNGSTVPTSDGYGAVTTLHVIRPAGDPDGDGLTNERELSAGSSIASTDTDQDGLADDAELREYGTDPTLADTDGDGLRDGLEIQHGTDPANADSDGDGLNDGGEIDQQLKPLNPDTDGDGLLDGQELARGTDPRTADTDGDGLDDGDEVAIGTSPVESDSDGDTLDDRFEHQVGTDPTSSWTPLAPLGVLSLALLVGLVVLVARAERIGMPSVRRTSSADTDRGDTATAGETAASDGTGEPNSTPALTDEEHVFELLEASGGREKQVEIVERTDWSKAKVSRVLSRMEEAGSITRIKVGRENLVCLAGHEPQGLKSPLDD